MREREQYLACVKAFQSDHQQLAISYFFNNIYQVF